MADQIANYGPLAYYEAAPGCSCPTTTAGGGAVPVSIAVTQDAFSSVFGVDFACLTDIDLQLSLVGGLKNLGYAIGRRFYTDEGFLFDSFEGDADYGKNILGRLNAGFTVAELAGLASQIEAQCRQDPRVKAAEVTVNQDTLSTSALNVEILLETSEGPFALVMKVTAETFTVDIFVPDAAS
jgi:hypothetical protein